MSFFNHKNIIFILGFIITYSQAQSSFNILSIQEIIKQDPRIRYQKCYDEVPFSFKEFPLSINPASHPSSGFFKETFIVTIPHGRAQSENGWTIVNNHFIKEMGWKGLYHHLQGVRQINDNQVIKVSGRVAVITQVAFFNYWHWLTEVLCRLALLELQGVKYDWLYVPQSSHFMKESLALWGIDSAKIIAPTSSNFCIEADELIIPSLVSSVSFGFVYGGCYAQPHLIKYVKEKLLTAALQKETTLNSPSKRAFISRKDAPQRTILNEDEVFEPFKKYGFARYELDKMSVEEQILLFYHAEIIVSPQGTGLANSIFCTEKTQVVELFQGLNDSTFWYLSQMLGFHYTAVKTIDFIPNYTTAWKSNTYMPANIINTVTHILNNNF